MSRPTSPIRFWRIAVTSFSLTPNETVGVKPATSAPADSDGD